MHQHSMRTRFDNESHESTFHENQIWYFMLRCLRWGPDLVFQVLHASFSSNLVRYVGVTKGFHQWRHHICQTTLVQFADQVQNEDQSWSLRTDIHHYIQTFLDMVGWQQNFISYIIVVVTWLWYSFTDHVQNEDQI